MELDVDLLEAWRAGDQRSGEKLVQRHLPALRRFFTSLAAGEAEDLTQATFEACVKVRDRLEREEDFRAYLFGVARNHLATHFRRAGRQPIAIEDDLVAAGSTPTARVGNKQDRRRLLRALRRLPVDLQVVIALAYWENFSTRQLAAALSIPEGTVGSRLNRARTALRSWLARDTGAQTWLTTTDDELDRWAREVNPAPSA